MTLYTTDYGLGEASKVLDDTWTLVDVETPSGYPLLTSEENAINLPILEVMLHSLLYSSHFDH